MNKIDTKGILIKIFLPTTVLSFSYLILGHFWLPFNNILRILVFAPVAYVAYKKKNIYISIGTHCLCNLISSISFVIEIMV